MTDKTTRMSIKEELARSPSNDFEHAYQGSSSPDDLVSMLIRAAGYPYVSAEADPDVVSFFAGHERSVMNEIVSVDSEGSLSGPHSKLIRDVYRIATAIEGELTEASYLPRSMRFRRVESVCSRLRVDMELFRLVLRNW